MRRLPPGDPLLHIRGWDAPEPVRLYWPATSTRKGPVPLIVFSHGLGGSRKGYSYLGEGWSARGTASVPIQHAGIDETLWQGNPIMLLNRLDGAADEREGDYHTLVRVSVKTADGERSVAGTLFGDQAPRLVELFGIKVEADLAGSMLYVVNEDAPGFIGRLGTTLGEAGVNIGTFHLGRRQAGGEAVLLLSVDEPVTADLLATVKALPGVKTAMGLTF